MRLAVAFDLVWELFVGGSIGLPVANKRYADHETALQFVGETRAWPLLDFWNTERGV